MKRKHIITVSGKPGSGKSSTADRVAELLGYTRHSSGDVVRHVLAKKHMTLEEYNRLAALDHNLDDKVDEELRTLRDHKDIVIDSRLGFYWIPESFKVYLDLDLEIATARVFKDLIHNKSRGATESKNNSLDAVAIEVRDRMNTERNRFKSVYGVDPFNTEHFDLIIDTSRHDPQTVAITVFDNYKEWLELDVWQQRHSAVPMGYSFKNQY
ncbi:MAG: cytidylate kinase family protein [Patescibacteria group bacterium]